MAGSADIAIVRMMTSHLARAAALRHAAFFAGTARTAKDDAVGLAALMNGDGFDAAFVAEADAELIGTCLLVRRELDPRHDLSPWLAGLVVAEEFRGRSIGSRLVRSVEDHARAQGCGAIHLYTDAAEPFYARLGWKVAARFDMDGEPSVLMSRQL